MRTSLASWLGEISHGFPQFMLAEVDRERQHSAWGLGCIKNWCADGCDRFIGSIPVVGPYLEGPLARITGMLYSSFDYTRIVPNT